MADASLEPLRFKRHFVEKVWGGRALAVNPGIDLPEGIRVGETWELVDRADANSVVADGVFGGRTLRSLMEARGSEILGTASPNKTGRFPLLVKYLDAAQNLSVQVHPDEQTAAEIGGDAEAKTEAWYVVDVKAGGVVYAGLETAIDTESFGRIASGPDVVAALRRIEVEPGDCLLVAGGTVHAIGAGVAILEVQQNSDTTYRLYDWGRMGLDGRPRETHVAEALRCARLDGEGPRPIRRQEPEPTAGLLRTPLAKTHVFTMDSLLSSERFALDTGGVCRIYAVTHGVGTLTLTGKDGEWRLERGDVWLVPASCGYHAAQPDGGEMLELIEMTPRG